MHRQAPEESSSVARACGGITTIEWETITLWTAPEPGVAFLRMMMMVVVSLACECKPITDSNNHDEGDKYDDYDEQNEQIEGNRKQEGGVKLIRF